MPLPYWVLRSAIHYAVYTPNKNIAIKLLATIKDLDESIENKEKYKKALNHMKKVVSQALEQETIEYNKILLVHLLEWIEEELKR